MPFQKGHPNYAAPAAPAPTIPTAPPDEADDEPLPAPIPPPAPPTAYADDDRVTVLYGYGQFKPRQTHYVDNYTFTGGVCRHVPYAVAKRWQRGVRENGTPSYNRLPVTIVPDSATETDFARVNGLGNLEPEKLGAILHALDLDLLCSTLGNRGVSQLIGDLQRRIEAR